MIIAEALQWGENSLSEIGIENSKMEALWLLSSTLNCSRNPSELYVVKDKNLDPPSLDQYDFLIQQRRQHIPLAYILKRQEFMGISLYVDQNVLIPRQETEILVEEAIKRIKSIKDPVLLEIGTGSGNISIALAKHLNNSTIFATDISYHALSIAKKNAIQNQVELQIAFLNANITEGIPLSGASAKGFDLIISNPPYICTEELLTLQKEIKFEPQSALDGGKDGLRIITPLIEQSVQLLKPNGLIMLEIGYNQSDAVLKLMERNGLAELGVVKDYSGIERIILGKKRA
jgi:release factor glutamine methyltransferase